MIIGFTGDVFLFDHFDIEQPLTSGVKFKHWYPNDCEKFYLGELYTV